MPSQLAVETLNGSLALNPVVPRHPLVWIYDAKMRITTQFLRSRVHRALQSVEYLDLSNLNIERIEKLSCCSKLRTLKLHGNKIDYVSNLESCSQLWNLDLSNNQIKSLEGLSRFVALGTLVLSNNDLSWSELARIRHMHILNISLHGNPQLERETYYRIHVIDSLPHIWMLDGRIITSAERLQVEHFFQESALTDHPVRHKLSKKNFQPSAMKNIEINGIFGQMTTHLMRRFPVNSTLNRDIDQLRLTYLAYVMEQDLAITTKNQKGGVRVSLRNKEFLQNMVKARQVDRKQCNMLLLLLVASLEFTMPSQLMEDALRTAQLLTVNDVYTMELFLLPRETRCSIASLLLSGVKLDKDMGEEGGLYDKLYLCLYYAVSELTRLAQGCNMSDGHAAQRKNHKMYQESRALVAAEVIQLFCIVPKFFEYISKDVGVTQMLLVAVGDKALPEKLNKLMTRAENEGIDKSQIYEGAADMIVHALQQTTASMMNTSNTLTGEIKHVLETRKALPRRPASSPLKTSEYHATGRHPPDHKSIRAKSAKTVDTRKGGNQAAKLGDRLLLGPQNIARIISIPEPDMVLVQMDIVPAESGAMVSNSKNPEAHYTYINLNQVYWDHRHCYWRPLGTVGDRITIQSVDDADKNMISAAEKIAVSSSNAKLRDRNAKYDCSPRGASGILASQNNTLAEQKTQMTKRQKKKSTQDKSPRSLSAQLKETLNFRLQAPQCNALLGPKQDTVTGSSHIQSLHTEATGQPVSTADVWDALKNTSQLPHISREKVPHLLEGSSLSNTRPSSAAVSALATIEDHENEEDLGMRQNSRRSSLESSEEVELYNIRSDSRPATAGYHRGEKAESAFGQTAGSIMSRPSTASKSIIASVGKSDLSLHGTAAQLNPEVTETSPEVPIEIPRVIEDPDSQMTTPTPVMGKQPDESNLMTSRDNRDAVDSTLQNSDIRIYDNSQQRRPSTVQDYKDEFFEQSASQAFSRSQSAFDVSDITEIEPSSSKSKTHRASYAMAASKQIGTIDNGYKMIVSHAGSTYHLSNYQNQRTEAWKHVSNPSIAGMSDVEGPPPQPPSSPIPKTLLKPGQSSVKVTKGNKWLAGGKDLHWEALLSRPKTSHVPGWKENMSPRPKSAAAIRAMRRTKSPSIVTPSSVAYDIAYGRGAASQYPHMQHEEGHHCRDYMPSAPQQQVRRLGTTATPLNSATSSPKRIGADFRWNY